MGPTQLELNQQTLERVQLIKYLDLLNIWTRPSKSDIGMSIQETNFENSSLCYPITRRT